MARLVDKSMPTTVVTLFDAIPNGEGGRQRGPGKTLLFECCPWISPMSPADQAGQAGWGCPTHTLPH